MNYFEIKLGSFSSPVAMPREEWKRKCQRQSVQGSKRGPKHVPGASKQTPKSSAQPIEHPTWQNLTLFDWMTVYAYVDTLTQPINQWDVVKYFAARPEGALHFTQSTLSRKLQQRPAMEACVHSNRNALSSKWPRIITRPDVDCALWLWVGHMEKKWEVVNSGMLIEKQAMFEEALSVPEDERLPGHGWVQSFCCVWVNFGLWTGQIATHIWVGTSSRRSEDMEKQDLWILWLWKRNESVWGNFWPDFGLKIAGISMNQPSLHLLHLIMDFPRGKWVENEQTSFKLHSALPAMQTVQRKRIFSSLESQRNHTALVDKVWLHAGFTIVQIKQLGWLSPFSKSEILGSNAFLSHWFTL